MDYNGAPFDEEIGMDCENVDWRLKNQVSSAIDNGQRKVQDIWQQLDGEKVQFSDETAFFNINSFIDLDKWERKSRNEKTNMC